MNEWARRVDTEAVEEWKAAGVIGVVSDRVWLRAAKRGEGCAKIELRARTIKGRRTWKGREKTGGLRRGCGRRYTDGERELRPQNSTQRLGEGHDDAGEGVSNRAQDTISTRENATVSNVENKSKNKKGSQARAARKSKCRDQSGREERKLTLLSQMAIELGSHL